MSSTVIHASELRQRCERVLQTFEREAAAFVDWLHGAPPAQGVPSVQVAGNPERTARAQREREGIRIDAGTWSEIQAAAAKVGA